MSEKEQVRAYRRGTSSGGTVRVVAVGQRPLRSLLESKALLALLTIMLLGAVLRFYGLGFQALWSDELASWDISNRERISQVIGGARRDDHSPLYFLILRFAQGIFGDSEWALRLPSAFAGWLCIPAIYLLGKRLYSEREGIVAALFLAVFWAPIYFSQEARVYSMLILLSILTSYFWKEVDYKEVFHFISQEDPDQQMISKFQSSFQPVQYERFDGAAVVVYKVRPSAPAGFPQTKPPDSLPRQE